MKRIPRVGEEISRGTTSNVKRGRMKLIKMKWVRLNVEQLLPLYVHAASTLHWPASPPEVGETISARFLRTRTAIVAHLLKRSSFRRFGIPTPSSLGVENLHFAKSIVLNLLILQRPNDPMCDCPQDRDDDSDDDQLSAGNQVELFGKCKGTNDSVDIDNWKAIVVLKPPFEDDVVKTRETLNTPSSDCSSDSTREYNFVDPRVLEYPCGEEESPEYPPIKCRSCTIEGEMEEEEEDQEPDIECTLAIIKPEAMICRTEIEDRILEEGFEVYQTRWLQLTPEQTSDFYADCYGQTNFALLVAYMSSAPIIAMTLAKHRAIEDWKHVMGPTKVAEARLYFPDSIRAKFGRRREDFENVVHGSENREQAEREIHFFFPGIILEPLVRGEMATDYLWQVINEALLQGLTLCCKRKPADPILWLANWLIINNPNKPKLPEDLAMIPT